MCSMKRANRKTSYLYYLNFSSDIDFGKQHIHLKPNSGIKCFISR